VSPPSQSAAKHRVPAEKALAIRLAISRSVAEGRTARSRLRLIDEDGVGIGERVVLRRWRRRRPTGRIQSYGGFRLPPGTWWVISMIIGDAPLPTCFTEQWLRERLDQLRDELARRKWRAPGPPNLTILLNHVLARKCLEDLLTRHELSNIRRPGVPDLLLFERDPKGEIRSTSGFVFRRV
jgi:hypothetical protein